jgi:hypothetical protein
MSLEIGPSPSLADSGENVDTSSFAAMSDENVAGAEPPLDFMQKEHLSFIFYEHIIPIITSFRTLLKLSKVSRKIRAIVFKRILDDWKANEEYGLLRKGYYGSTSLAIAFKLWRKFGLGKSYTFDEIRKGKRCEREKFQHCSPILNLICNPYTQACYYVFPKVLKKGHICSTQIDDEVEFFDDSSVADVVYTFIGFKYELLDKNKHHYLYGGTNNFYYKVNLFYWPFIDMKSVEGGLPFLHIPGFLYGYNE